MSPWLRVAVFGAAFAAAGSWAAVEFVLLARRRWRGRGGPASPPPPSAAVRVRRAAGLAVGAAILACVAWGALVEPNLLTRTRETIHLRGLAGPLRIVHLTDLHCDAAAGLEDAVVATVREEAPDLVCLTGDYLNSHAGLDRFRAAASALAAVAPCYAVRGNWEAGLRARPELFEGTGVVELDGAPAAFESGGVRLTLAGLPWSREARAADALEGVARGAPVVFLYHSPDLADEAATLGADLALAGHTHGGQVRLPFYGALLTLSRTDKRYEMGRYAVGPMTLFVSRGIGTTGAGPRVRFLCPPEVAVLDLRPAPPPAPR